MTGCNNQTVSYCSPAHGGWGIVRVGMLVPQSHQLFVCPSACGRHGAIGALTHGNKDRLSYLYIDEADIISGSYEDLIVEAVDELFDALGYRPRALFIFVSCLDDLLGTDHPALLRVLRTKYPDVAFTDGHMNPISTGGKLPPPVNILCKMYGLLQKAEDKQKAVNLIGNHVPLPPTSELCRLLDSAGYAVRQIGACKTYDEFLSLSKSCLNIVTRPTGLQAAKEMEETLGIPYLYLPVTSSFSEIEEGYEKLCRTLNLQPDALLPHAKQEAAQAIEKAQAVLCGRPVAVDFSATTRPFTLARLLYENGFAVTGVYAQDLIALERESQAWLAAHSSVAWINPTHHNAVVHRTSEPETLAVGFECAYHTGSEHVADLVDDEGLYGYDGISRLMNMLIAAGGTQTNVRQLIDAYGLVGVSMYKLSVRMPPFSPDYSGVCSALFHLGGLLVIHDASGCTGNYTGYDEPRWFGASSMVYCSSLREMDAVLGDDQKLIDKIIAAAKDLHPKFIAVLGSPVPMVIGTDFKGIAAELEALTGIPSFGFDTTGLPYYDRGVSAAWISISRRFVPKQAVKRAHTVNLLGLTPLDFGLHNTLADAKQLFADLGYAVVADFGLESPLETLSISGEASVNAVFSASGLALAKHFYKEYGIPYVTGFPTAASGISTYHALLHKAEREGVPQHLGTPDTEEKQVLIVHDQIIASSLRAGLVQMYGPIGVHTATTFGFDPALAHPGDCRWGSEGEIRRLLGSGYHTIVADPLFRMLLEPDSPVHFVDLPHAAVSSKLHWDAIPDLIGERASDILAACAQH